MLPLLIIVCLACFVTALLDMGMNGSAGAEWAPYGLGITVVCGVAAWYVSP